MGKKKSRNAQAAPSAGAEVRLDDNSRVGLLQTVFQMGQLLGDNVPESAALLKAAGPLPGDAKKKFKKAVMALHVAKNLDAVERALLPARQCLVAHPLHLPVFAKEVRSGMGEDGGTFEFPLRRAQGILLEAVAREAVAAGTEAELEAQLVGMAAPAELAQLHKWIAQQKEHPVEEEPCGFCGVAPTGGVPFEPCGGCGVARFCSEDCTLLGLEFAGHRRGCDGPKALRPPPEKRAAGDAVQALMDSPAGPRLQEMIASCHGDQERIARKMEGLRTSDPELFRAMAAAQMADASRGGGHERRCARLLLDRLEGLVSSPNEGSGLRLHLQALACMIADPRGRSAVPLAAAMPLLQAIGEPAVHGADDAGLARAALAELAMHDGHKAPMVEAGLVEWALERLGLPDGDAGESGEGLTDEERGAAMAGREPALQAARLLAELVMSRQGMTRAGQAGPGVVAMAAALTPAVARCQVAGGDAYVANIGARAMMIANPVGRTLLVLSQFPSGAGALRDGGVKARCEELGAWLAEHKDAAGAFNTASILAGVAQRL